MDKENHEKSYKESLCKNEYQIIIANNLEENVIDYNKDLIWVSNKVGLTESIINNLYEQAYSRTEIGAVIPFSNYYYEFPKEMAIKEKEKFVKENSLYSFPKVLSIDETESIFIKKEILPYLSLYEGKLASQILYLGYECVLCDNVWVEYTNKYHKDIEDSVKDIIINFDFRLEQINGRKNILYVIHGDFRADASNNEGGTQYHVRDLTYGLKDEFNVFVAARDGEYLRLTRYIGDKILSLRYYIGKQKETPVFYQNNLYELFREIIIGFHINVVHVHHVMGLSLDIFKVCHELGTPVLATVHDYYYIGPLIILKDQNHEISLDEKSLDFYNRYLSGNYEDEKDKNYLKKWREENKKALFNCEKIITPSFSAQNIFSDVFPDLKDKIKVIYHGTPVGSNKNIMIDHVITTSKIKWNLDDFHGNKYNQNAIMGWAYFLGKNSLLVTTFLEITDSKNNVFCYKTSKYKRNDIFAANCDNSNYFYSGFSLNMFRGKIAKGEFKVRIILELGGKYYTDGKEIIVENDFELEEKKDMRVAFLGGMVPTKGSQTAYDMIKSTTEGIDWYIFGTLADEKLANLDQENLTKIGTYHTNELPDLLKGFKIDLICLLPLIPETFCFTLSEAILSKIPVLATDTGAVSERMKENRCGWLIPVESKPDEIIEYIRKIRGNREDYEEKLTNIETTHIKSIEEMLAEYKGIYSTIVSSKEIAVGFSAKFIYNGYLEVQKHLIENPEKVVSNLEIKVDSLEEQVIKLSADLNNAYLGINDLHKEINNIHESTSYKIGNKIANMKVPFKNQLLKLYKLKK